jgi:hypothetical protein
VNFTWDGLKLTAESDGARLGEVELKEEPPRVWVARLEAYRPGVEEELFREALARARELERRRAQPAAPSHGRVFVQTDRAEDVERAARQYVPRLGRSERTEVHGPRNGWVEIEDELTSREPQLLRKLAQELSYRFAGVVVAIGVEQGAVVRYVLFDRGSIADEYASVPEFFGPLPPGDVVALAANPTVVQRLTGAEPARVREVARTAEKPEELDPPDQLYRRLLEVLGLGSEA